MMKQLELVLNAIRQDQGAALVTVLLLVSVMALGAVLTFDAMGYSIKRTGALRAYDQARQYAIGGEQLAVSVAESLYETKANLSAPRAVSFAIEGGRIDGLISDQSNCFNVNSLVLRRDAGTLIASEERQGQFVRLFAHLGMSDRQAQELVASLTDWIDTDERPLPLGAEDYDYAALEQPYRTGNSLIADLSELKMVKGFGPELFDQLEGFLCADASTDRSVFNVNTLTPQEAPLLVALIGGDFTFDQAVELILARPTSGYSDVADFWLDPIVAGRQVDQSIRQQTTVKPHRFNSRIRVTHYDAVSHLNSEIKVDNSGIARVVRHSVGVLP